MRRKIRCDCAGEPPGELMMSATAAALRTANSRSSARAMPAMLSPGRSGVEKPMTPVRRSTGTTGRSLRKRCGTSSRSAVVARLQPSLTRSPVHGSAMKLT